MAVNVTLYPKLAFDLRRDLAIWVKRLADDQSWVPAYFEFSFGLQDEGRIALAAAMAALPNVVPYLDMPLQHGSDSVLRRMKRPTLSRSSS